MHIHFRSKKLAPNTGCISREKEKNEKKKNMRKTEIVWWPWRLGVVMVMV